MVPPGPLGFGTKLERVIEKFVPFEKTADPQIEATFSPRSSKMVIICWPQVGEVWEVGVAVIVTVGVKVGVLVIVLVTVVVTVLVKVIVGVLVTVKVGV
jgi:hypothetical protein